jgi:tetratricopeptide (TPR) repeat protein/Fe-S-cluster-containing hydrogenase component 2
MAAHVLHWKLAGRTLAPLELNEVMYTLELGIVTAGFIFMAITLLATLLFGRFFCSWGCHILALEDLSAWLLSKLRIRPKPVRSRTLLWVPFIAMLYMFAWPQFTRLLNGNPMPAMHLRTDAQGWASFMTTNFWRNLPGPGITILTFVVCGFIVVYFLGSRAFCTYACPYGAIFSLADRFAPGRIVATGDCAKCGVCTATCQSRVRVHEEVAAFGRVVDPACLKDLDCVSVCPNGALAYGFSLPAIFERSKSSRFHSRPYDFTLGEDLLNAGVFIVSLLIFRGLYQAIPFLLTLALGGILGYASVLAVRLLHQNHVKLNNFQLKVGGALTRTGHAFVGWLAVVGALTAHSAFIRYHEFCGDRLFQIVAQQHEPPVGTTAATVAQALVHLDFCDRWGIFRPADLPHRQATLHATIGQQLADKAEFAPAIDHLRLACDLSPDIAFLHYNLGVMLAQTGSGPEAIVEYRRAMAIDPTDPEIYNNLGFSLAQRGEFESAAEHFRRAIALKPDFAHPHFNLARILEAQGWKDEANDHFERAASLDPDYRALLSPPAVSETAATTNPITHPEVRHGELTGGPD